MNTKVNTGHDEHSDQNPAASANRSALKDPVFGMTVTDQSPYKVEHEGKPF